MLLTIHIKDYQPRKVVQYFEILREKGPERSSRSTSPGRRPGLSRHRRVSSAPISSSARLSRPATSKTPSVGEALRQRASTFEGIGYLIDLWRE